MAILSMSSQSKKHTNKNKKQKTKSKQKTPPLPSILKKALNVNPEIDTEKGEFTFPLF